MPRRALVAVAGGWFVSMFLTAAACGGGGNDNLGGGTSGQHGGDAGSAGDGPQSVVEASVPDVKTTPAPTTYELRLAGISNFQNAFDYCVANAAVALGDGGPPSGAKFVGPVLAKAGLNDGVGSGQVSERAAFQGGPQTVMLVAAGAGDCTTPLGGAPAPITFTAAAQSLVTVARLSDGNGGEILKVFVDAPVEAGKAKLRLVHGATIGPVDMVLDDGNAPEVAFDDVAFGSFGKNNADATPGIDATGWRRDDQWLNTTLTIVDTGSGNTIWEADGVAYYSDAAYSFFTRGDNQIADLLVCDDDAPPVNHLAACQSTGGPPM